MSSGLMSAARFVKSTPRLLNAVDEPGASDASAAGVERLVVDRQAVDDHQRLVAAADRADAADGDRRRRAGHAGRARHFDAGDAALQRVDEVLALRLRDVRSLHRLLRRAERALRRRLAERRGDDGVERRRHALELDVDDVLGADGPLFRRGADEPELQHLPAARRGCA